MALNNNNNNNNVFELRGPLNDAIVSFLSDPRRKIAERSGNYLIYGCVFLFQRISVQDLSFN